MKLRRLFGMCLVILVFAGICGCGGDHKCDCNCGCGCGNDDKKETTISSVDAIRTDDTVIQNVHRNCSSLLAEEEFYSNAQSTVKVEVYGNGEITVRGLTNGTKFVQLLKNSVYGSDTATNIFSSKVYRTGAPTTLEYTFDSTLYTWKFQIYNYNEGSRYCQAQ